MSNVNLAYYADRRDQELRAAAEAISAEAASAHRILAEIYLIEVERLITESGTAVREVVEMHTYRARRATPDPAGHGEPIESVSASG